MAGRCVYGYGVVWNNAVPYAGCYVYFADLTQPTGRDVVSDLWLCCPRLFVLQKDILAIRFTGEPWHRSSLTRFLVSGALIDCSMHPTGPYQKRCPGDSFHPGLFPLHLGTTTALREKIQLGGGVVYVLATHSVPLPPPPKKIPDEIEGQAKALQLRSTESRPIVPPHGVAPASLSAEKLHEDDAKGLFFFFAN